MAKERLNIDITANDKASGKINNVSSSMGNMSKKTKGGVQALTQLARGLDDAQYGMQGLRNNLIEVGLSFGGLKGVAISAALVGLGYFIESLFETGEEAKTTKSHVDGLTSSIEDLVIQFKALNDEANGTGIDNLLADVYGSLEDQEGTLSNINKLYNEYQDSLDAASKSHDKDGKLAIAAKEKEIELLKSVKKHVDESSKNRISQINKEIKKQEELLKSTDDDERKKAAERIKELEEQKATALGKQLSATNKLREATRQLNKLKLGKDTSGKGSGYVEGIGIEDGLAIEETFGPIVDPKDVLVLDEWDQAEQDLDALLTSIGSKYANLSTEQAKALKQIEDAQMTSAEKSQMWAGAMIGAFESAATQGGNFLENLAKGILSSLGSILIQQGTAAIFSGIAKNAIVPGSGSGSIKKGGLVVAAGIALKAGANIAGRSGSSGGGGSSPTGRSVNYTSPNATPTQTNEGANSGRMIGELELRGDTLVVGLQAANETRSRY